MLTGNCFTFGLNLYRWLVLLGTACFCFALCSSGVLGAVYGLDYYVGCLIWCNCWVILGVFVVVGGSASFVLLYAFDWFSL